MPQFTAEELRELLDMPTIVNDPDAMTVVEIAATMGASESATRRHISSAIKAGTWECVGQVLRYRRNGATYYVDAYKPVVAQDAP